MDSKYWTTGRLNQSYDKWPKQRLADLKAQVARSKWRLGYHIQTRTGLLNDPNGFSYFNHQWHLFYQTFPFGAVHGLKSWTHLVSTDLVNWKNVHHPMIPNRSNDRNGCYSGSAIPVGHRLFLMYTGNIWDEHQHRQAKQDGAWVDKDNHITKVNQPLINRPPLEVTGNFRDPQIIKHGDYYYAILGAQTEGHRGEIVVYRSQSVDHGWNFFRTMDVGNDNLGYMVECPNLIFIDKHPVILFCPQGLDKKHLNYRNRYPNVYIAGDSLNWDQMKIVNPTKIRLIDNGFDFYATSAINAPDGRDLSISWVGMPGSEYATDSEGWSGALTLVREFDLKDGRLIQKPARENQKLFVKKLKAVNGMEIPQQCHIKWVPMEDQVSQLAITAETSHLYFVIDQKGRRLSVYRQNLSGNEKVRRVSINRGMIQECLFYFDNSEFEIYINGGSRTITGRFFRNGENVNLNWIDCQSVKVAKLKSININND
ncbi:MAG: sucrose-6-phosphate hydrolase [Acetilactobacillus jinshanensis]